MAFPLHSDSDTDSLLSLAPCYFDTGKYEQSLTLVGSCISVAKAIA